MFYSFGQFGGFISVAGREVPVLGKTYRHIAECEGYMLSLCLDPLLELRRLIREKPELAQGDFVERYLKQTRLLLGDLMASGKQRLQGSWLGRRFELYQATGGTLRIEELDDFLDSIPGAELAEFWVDVDRKIAIASGRDELGVLGSMMRTRVVSQDSGDSTEKFMAQLVMSWKVPPAEILNLTPQVLSTICSDPEHLEDDLDLEKILPDDDFDPTCKRYKALYRQAAENIRTNRRIDAPSAEEDDLPPVPLSWFGAPPDAATEKAIEVCGGRGDG